MVVMTVISVVSGFALIRLDRARNFQQRENVAMQLKSQLERARYDSIKRRATAPSQFSRVIINQTSFSLQIDSNQDGVLEANESQNFTFDSGVSGKFVGNLNFPLTISFDHHGRAKTVDNNNAEKNSVLTLCNENCVSTNNDLFLTKSNSSIISVSRTGTVTVKPGDVTTIWTRSDGFTTSATMPNAAPTTTSMSSAAPTATSIDPSEGINPFIRVQSFN